MVASHALLTGDSATLDGKLASMAADTSTLAATAIRSLRPVRLGLAGNRKAAADSLTRFVRLLSSTVGSSALSDGIFAPIKVERARILGALGQREEALMSARAVVNSEVQPSASMKPVVEEARKIAARLASTDEASSKAVPVRAPQARRRRAERVKAVRFVRIAAHPSRRQLRPQRPQLLSRDRAPAPTRRVQMR